MADGSYPEKPGDKVTFTLTGETTRFELEAITRLVGKVCAEHNAVYFPTVSPSVAIEVLPQPDGTGVLAITEDSVEQFLLGEDASDMGAHKEADQIYGGLVHHLRAGHETFGGRYILVGGDLCSCPLEPAEGEDRFNDLTGGCVGIEPFSFIDFAAKGDVELLALLNGYGNRIHRFGAKRLAVIKSMRYKLMVDLEIEVPDEVLVD